MMLIVVVNTPATVSERDRARTQTQFYTNTAKHSVTQCMEMQDNKAVHRLVYGRLGNRFKDQ